MTTTDVGSIDVDDYEVVILSPGSYAQVLCMLCFVVRRLGIATITADRPIRTSRYMMRKRPATSGGRSNSKKKCAKKLVVTFQAVPPKPPPKELAFNCPVCMSSLVEATSTKCGHIFCKQCINYSLSAQSKCPTCRKKLSMKDTIRVYLPACEMS
ncbi:hypothetical protein MKW94_015948 [Papaver nudicaule]|uniref:RING-type domain-containing protein n=1 Tax=Papaver nudicaule TaxID=74823 RepID=A0AA41VSN4_PAPNU|nr:hypothetical protein [Papaver nudicaule]